MLTMADVNGRNLSFIVFMMTVKPLAPELFFLISAQPVYKM